MNSETFHNIPERVADDNCLPERLRRNLETEMFRQAAEGKVLILTDEEGRMVRSFRKFRSMAKKNGAVFTWQTTPAGEPAVSSPR